ncbi:hypothetical protein VB715_05715 [Crocosphaera sp. UHCC 0190]|uniref:hypothetical protein n=1 Tax=Crocosphaera sp. UHCC 0190 TaxID=3110246 RepID=UPI002B1F8376|nr:hypothetical protein [Crocosphaera sp. UHCC 0190]MEA5509257.1 hypothetical protein [Crocosphaera sp. UHCC 0190]
MSTVTESDIKELKDLINSRFDRLEKEVSDVRVSLGKEVSDLRVSLGKEVSDLRVSLGKVEGSLQNQQQFVQKIPDLAEKVGELKNWRQIVIIVLTALISGSVTWVIRGGTLKP